MARPDRPTDFQAPGRWEWDYARDRGRCTAALAKLIGLPAGARRLGAASWLAAVHPDDAEAAIAALQAVLAGAGPQTLAHRFLRPDGDAPAVVTTLRSEPDPRAGTIRVLGCSEAA